MALEDLVSTEGKGERIQGSVVHKVSSAVCRQTFQEGSSKKKQDSWLAGRRQSIPDIRVEGCMYVAGQEQVCNCLRASIVFEPKHPV